MTTESMPPDATPHTFGSGGGPDTADRDICVDGTFAIVATEVHVLGCPTLPPAPHKPGVVNILAAGFEPEGMVNISGAQGVRVTSGLPELPPIFSDDTNGVEVVVGELQNVTIQRGLVSPQKLEIKPLGITIDAQAGRIEIQSLTEIKLSVGGGMSTITLTPKGIQIKGPLVEIN